MFDVLVATVSALLIAAVTKWLAVGGRERRRRTRLIEDLDLLQRLSQMRPATTAVASLESHIDTRANDYVKYAGSQQERADSRWSLGLVLTSAVGVWVALAIAGRTPSAMTGGALVGWTFVLGLVLGGLSVAVEPLVRKVRRL